MWIRQVLFSPMKKIPHHEGGEGIASYNNTHHAAFAVVDDFLHGVLQF